MGNSAKLKTISIAKLVIVLALVVAPIFYGYDIFATGLSDPDTTPSLTFIHANRDLAYTGDIFIFGEYNIPYASPPSTKVDSAFVLRLMDGTTDLGEVTLFPYFDNGYNQGIFGIYFSPTDVTAKGIVWGTQYTLRLSENPAQFASPVSWDSTLTTDEYSLFDTMANNRTEAADKIVTIGKALETAYSITLFTTSGSLAVLTSTSGETYFRGAIPNLQSLVPSLFLVQSSNLDLTDRSWSTAQFDTYDTRFNGTWVGDSETAIQTETGLSKQMVLGMAIGLPLCLGAMIFSGMKFKKTEPGLIFSALVLIMLVLMGWFPKALFASVYQLMGLYISYLWFFARS